MSITISGKSGHSPDGGKEQKIHIWSCWLAFEKKRHILTPLGSLKSRLYPFSPNKIQGYSLSVTNTIMKFAAEPEQTGFFWTRIPNFTPPDKEGSIAACLQHKFAPPRAGNLKTLLNRFLETAISMTHAGAGVIRITLPDEQTLQIISSIGLSVRTIECSISAAICLGW